jgi:2-methylcitrate dehydratase PrpD
MLAGSQSSPTDIVCDIIKLEGSAPVATIVGRPLRASPQLAALANGVAAHAMDFDLNTATQSAAIARIASSVTPPRTSCAALRCRTAAEVNSP